MSYAVRIHKVKFCITWKMNISTLSSSILLRTALKIIEKIYKKFKLKLLALVEDLDQKVIHYGFKNIFCIIFIMIGNTVDEQSKIKLFIRKLDPN